MFTHTLPLALAAAIPELVFPDSTLAFRGPVAEVGGAGVALLGFASEVEAAEVAAGAALAGSAADSVVINFLLRRVLGFLTVSEFVSLDAACGFDRAGDTTIVSSRQSARAPRVRLRLG